VEKLLARFKIRCTPKRWHSAVPTPTTPRPTTKLKKAVENGFAFSGWCGSGDCEGKIKEETPRNHALHSARPGSGPRLGGGAASGKCVYCGQTAKNRAIFARAY